MRPKPRLAQTPTVGKEKGCKLLGSSAPLLRRWAGGEVNAIIIQKKLTINKTKKMKNNRRLFLKLAGLSGFSIAGGGI